MNIKEIEYEIAKWEDMSFLEEIKKELCDYVNELDKIISRRYRKIIQEMVQQVIQRFQYQMQMMEQKD